MRFLVILVALAVIVVVVKRLWRSSRPPATPMKEPGRMVQCAHCGIYIPEPEAFHQGDHYYCSRAHLEADSHKPS